jgi:hypothetical protein
MTIKITRAFERTRQIADFVPIKAYCEATTEVEVSDRENSEIIKKDQFIRSISNELDQFVQAEVEKTLMAYRPVCIRCGGKGDKVNLNKEGVCGNCVSEMNIQARGFAEDNQKNRTSRK